MQEELVQAASRVRESAYAPYSGYRVGAAVQDEQGRIHVGCNVENVSYGLTLCAERAAVARMIAEGGTKVRAAAVATQDGGTPCGMCLQTLAEFAEDPSKVEIRCIGNEGESRTFKLSELMPMAFKSVGVARTPATIEGSTST